ncbi:MAG TPA: hypothetical protein VGJ09_05900 [Bryobacteraceae bacterium]
MPEPHNGNGHDRLDHMERVMQLLVNDHVKFREEHERFQDEHQRLLTAQVLLTEQVEKLAGRVDAVTNLVGDLSGHQKRLDSRVDKLADAVQNLLEGQKHTDQRLNALITIVDDLIRKRPPQ